MRESFEITETEDSVFVFLRDKQRKSYGKKIKQFF
jgi:hypothetical protein